MEQLQARVGVGVIVLNGAQVLLIRRGKPPKMNQWSLPGGHLELGETLHAAASREVQEETGLSVLVRDLVDVVDLIDVAADGSITRQYALIDYWADVVCGTVRAGDDAIAAAWFNLDDIGTLGMWDKTIEVIFKAVRLRDAAVTEGRLI
jgi:ADP-ribose pyrophosphatase YjhB (NUDIX family)